MRVIFFMICLIPIFAFSQKIENVKAEVSGEKVYIHYNIISSVEGETYKISAYCITDNKEIKLVAASGDIGYGVTAGREKEIVWDVFKDVDELKTVEFEIQIDKVTPPISLTDKGNKLTAIDESFFPPKQNKKRDQVYLKNGEVKKGLIVSTRFVADTFKFKPDARIVYSYKSTEINIVKNRTHSIDTIYLKAGDKLVGHIKDFSPNDKVNYKLSSGLKMTTELKDIAKVSSYDKFGMRKITGYSQRKNVFGIEYNTYEGGDGMMNLQGYNLQLRHCLKKKNIFLGAGYQQHWGDISSIPNTEVSLPNQYGGDYDREDIIVKSPYLNFNCRTNNGRFSTRLYINLYLDFIWGRIRVVSLDSTLSSTPPLYDYRYAYTNYDENLTAPNYEIGYSLDIFYFKNLGVNFFIAYKGDKKITYGNGYIEKHPFGLNFGFGLIF